ncbi:MAG: glycoside hydrolase family 31 protein [Armatimonadetes bacterium]|nr:glycoside hydrolase family 31 protein [Armatimonadota bacterium]
MAETIERASGALVRTVGECTLRVETLADGLLRIQAWQGAAPPPSALLRYGFFRHDFEPPAEPLLTAAADAAGRLTFSGPSGETLLAETTPLTTSPRPRVRFALPAEMGLFGLGDQTRERLDQRGTRPVLWVRNVSGYIPIPFLWTSGGYGIVVNTTRRLIFDLGQSNPSEFGFEAAGGSLDYYLLYGPTPREILARYTALTGRPPLWPKWALGLTFVCRTQADSREFLDDCYTFRREGIPCDAISLEPGWMAKDYDFSVTKEWHPEKFVVPSYARRGPTNFLDAARRMGYKPGLWLCNDYDLSYEEERRLAGDSPVEEDNEAVAQGFEDDPHFALKGRRLDTITRPDEPWFKHLGEFVEQGVDWFKQDGANQVLDHPDRLYGNGMRDDEMHNLYPLLYSKQMYEGFREQTGRRPWTFTPAGWAGLQRWTATWTGDTGGGELPLAACLNLSLSGHGMSTPDMEVNTPEGIHFGFLLPWSQLNSWNYYRHPWYQGDFLCDMVRDYARLRYRLLPYLYAGAWEAAQTGYPLLRAMPLEYPDQPEARARRTQYLLGPSLLVGAFTRELWVPEGGWYNFWSDEAVTGGGVVTPTIPADRGGPLLVRAGAILPMGPAIDYVGQRPEDELTLHLYAGGASELLLYEDDGVSFAHESGASRLTRIRWQDDQGQATLTMEAAAGSFAGAPKDRRLELVLHAGGEPRQVDLGRRPVAEAITHAFR